MKFFEYKKAMTLVELIIAVSISAVMILIVSIFIGNSIEDLASSNILTESIEKGFIFRDELDRKIRSGFGDFKLYGSENRRVVVMENNDGTEGVIYGIVDGGTKKLDPNYIYGNKYIGYRILTANDLLDIQTNSGVIYNYSFFQDKIYNTMRIKNFNATLYNTSLILDLDISIVMLKDEENFGLNFNNFIILKENIFNYNLTF